jgi:hypothetical protein
MTVAQPLFKVQDLFELAGRGLVVVVDATYEMLPDDLHIKIGTTIRISRAAQEGLIVRVVGLEHCDPWTPARSFAFLLPGTIAKSEIPIGSEVWSVEGKPEESKTSS